MKKLILVFLLGLSTLGYALSFGVYPTNFNLDTTKMTINEVTLTNNTKEPLRITIFPEKDIEFGEEFNLNENITVAPKTISIKPGLSQIVRFRVKPFSKDKEGEYRSYLTFKEVPTEIKREQVEENNNLKSEIQFITEISISVSGIANGSRVDGEIKNIELKTKDNIAILKGNVFSQGNTSLRLKYELVGVTTKEKYEGNLGTSKRVGENTVATQFEIDKKLKGEKFKLIITDQNNKKYFEKLYTL